MKRFVDKRLCCIMVYIIYLRLPVKPQERDVLKFNVDLNTIHHYKSKGFKIDVDVIGPRIIRKRPKAKSESDYSVDYLKQLTPGRF